MPLSPGGGAVASSLVGEENHDRIRKFVADGKVPWAFVPVLLFSSTPGYSCLQLNGAKAIDMSMITGDTGSKVYPYRRGEVVSRNCPSRHSYVMYYEDRFR